MTCVCLWWFVCTFITGYCLNLNSMCVGSLFSLWDTCWISLTACSITVIRCERILWYHLKCAFLVHHLLFCLYVPNTNYASRYMKDMSNILKYIYLKRLKWESLKMPFLNYPWKTQKALFSSSMDCSALLRIFLSNLLVRSILITHRGVLRPTTVRGKWGSPWGSVPVWRCGGVLMLRRLHHGGF